MMIFLGAAIVVAALAAWTDWRSGEIPNWLTFGVVLVAPIAHIVVSKASGAPFSQALYEGAFSVCGALLCALVPIVLYARDAIGGGDVKLFAALGALAMPRIGIELQMYGFVAAALIAPARLAYDGKLMRTMKNAVYILVNPLLPKSKRQPIESEMMAWVRLGPAILLGTILAAVSNWRAS